jgi:hypothetical protein
MITGPGDHDQPDWLITMTGMRTIRRQDNDLGLLDVLLKPVAILSDRGQSLAVRRVDEGGDDGLRHPYRLT